MQFRRAVDADLPALHRLWREAFGDTDELIDRFFGIFGVDAGIVGFDVGETVGAAYVLPTGGLVFPSGKTACCSYIYAVAVSEAQRGHGFGKELTLASVRFSQEAGFEYAALRPSDEGLYRFYGKLGFVPFFREDRSRMSASALPCPVRPAAPERYARLREQTLRDFTHIAATREMAAYQACLGRLYELPSGCAAAETGENGHIEIRELLGADETVPSAVSGIAATFSAVEADVTRPSADGIPAGMIFPPPPDVQNGYLGLSFG